MNNNSKEFLPRILTNDIKRMKYDKTIETRLNKTDNLHWGQRKLLMSEIEFLTNYYDDFEDNKQKYVLYIGSADGHHINYLIDMFPDINFILFDKRKTYVNKPTAEVHQRYFDNNDIQKYKNKNLFMICDIRNLEVADYKNALNKLDELILEDMRMQKEWFLELKPKRALLKFRLPYTIQNVEYLDGVIYFQLWSKNASTETRIVPNNNIIKYDTKKYEEQLFYFNNEIRRKSYNNNKYPCLGDNYDCIIEADIIKKYLLKFKQNNKEFMENIDKSVCDISLSITLFLSKHIKNSISKKYLK